MWSMYHSVSLFFFFNDTATTEIYTLSLHDALPICAARRRQAFLPAAPRGRRQLQALRAGRRRHGSRSRRSDAAQRSEEHTSELQSQSNLVCRLLLEKKKQSKKSTAIPHYSCSRTSA